MEDVDVTILGGGCSGLSLATALTSTHASGRRIRIIEPRTDYRRDRTWCFWNVTATGFEETIQSRWMHWETRRGGSTHRRSARAYDYVEIPSDRFYDLCLDRLSATPDVELVLGERMSGVERRDGGYHVETTAGTFGSRWVFDARPAGAGLPTAAPCGDDLRLWQHFGGQHVRTREPAFDPTTVTLMDFDVDASRGIHFVYVLPYSTTRALVESTYFSPQPLARDVYAQDVAAYLEQRFGVREIEVLDEESGRLPMFDVVPTPPAPGVVPIGIAGGACRPSTGYAFLAIQRQVQHIARVLDANEPMPVGALASLARIDRGPILRGMDELLLTFLRRRPDEAPMLFHRLFERAEPDALARFLMDIPRPSDLIAVIRAMPASRFLRGVVPGFASPNRVAA